MIRWGTLMAGMLGFIMVLALGLSMGKAWERTLPARCLAPLPLVSLASGGCACGSPA